MKSLKKLEDEMRKRRSEIYLRDLDNVKKEFNDLFQKIIRASYEEEDPAVFYCFLQEQLHDALYHMEN